ncbi:MAG: glutamate-1-semialdehyde 2,1-aminomutase [Clostridia bacterium]|nr:glutamate-1-semialdehyde 2,1-aminomutase [Clostridia bacterium]
MAERADEGSRRLWEAAGRVLPGGVNSPVRSFRAVGGVPRFIARGQGARVWDVDGVEYLDLVGSWGPLILGHADPEVVAAVQAQAARGTSYGAPTELEVELAEQIVAAIPSVEKVRLVNSGTEAAMTAVRLARGYTGRPRLVKFVGCYHGHVDSLLVRAGSGALTLGVPDSAGIPPGVAADTIALPYNDLGAAEEAFDRWGREVAAVIVEPVAGNMGCVPPEPGFLEGLRRLVDRHGALLIFDEVITGFRLAYGGAQSLYGVMPDLTCLGKVIGGGLPVGAVGGRAEVMDHLAPAGPVYQAGTLSGNPLAVAAGLATLARLRRPGVYEALARRGERLAGALREAAAACGLPVTVNQVGSLLTLFFTPGPVRDHEGALRADTARFARFFHAMLDRGVLLPPSPFECWFVSLAHGDAEIDAVAAAARESLAAVADGEG